MSSVLPTSMCTMVLQSSLSATSASKNFIYQGLNVQKSDVCFVQHNPNLNEIYFCYLSGDQHVAFPTQPGATAQPPTTTAMIPGLSMTCLTCLRDPTANVESVNTYTPPACPMSS